jgi:hypothetical protein
MTADERREYARRHAKNTRFRRYKIDEATFNRMFEEQGRKCAVCGSKRPNRRTGRPPKEFKWCIDHDHETEAVRGIVCYPCNTALGLVRDDVRTLKAMIAYLEKASIHNRPYRLVPAEKNGKVPLTINSLGRAPNHKLKQASSVRETT